MDNFFIKQWLFFMLLLILPYDCFALVLHKPVYIFDYKEFYKTPSGTIAFVPYILRKESVVKALEYQALMKSGAYRLRKQEKYYFIVNHRLESKGPTYLGVMVVPILPDWFKPSKAVAMYRNDRWYRSDDPEYKNNNEKIIGAKIDIYDFFRAHREASTLVDLDDRLSYKWHGQIEEAEVHSWNDATLWDNDPGIEDTSFYELFNPPVSGRNVNLMIKSSLIRFEPTESLESNHPVVFKFNGDNRIAVYVRIFFPADPGLDKIYYLTFK